MELLFITDVHGVRDFVPPLIERESTADVVLLGGDTTNFGGESQIQGILQPLRKHFPNVLALPGNVDQPHLLDYLEQEGISLHGRGTMLENLGIFGCGGSNPTPLHTPFELEESELAQLLERGHRDVVAAEMKVLVSHTPPVDTRTDRMFAGKHVGSTAVRAFLEARSLALCLCGHIHEAAGEDQVGSVPVVNPGPFSSGRYAHIDVGERGVVAEIRRLEVNRLIRTRARVKAVSGKIGGFVRSRVNRNRP